MTKQKISWVLPIYNESDNISALLEELNNLRNAIKNKYTSEFIFVNDGSKDNSFVKLKRYFEKDNDIKIINFSRNFGHQIAITAGLDHATGDAIIFMDSDLQDPPNVCLKLIEEWEKGADVAYAKRRTRQDSIFKKFTAYWFYRILRSISSTNIPEDTGDFRLISRQVADVLKTFPEKNRFMRGLVSYVGFTQKAVLFDRDKRHAGKTGYSIKRMVELAENAFTGFSLGPIMIVGFSGLSLVITGIFATIIGLCYINMFLITIGFMTALTGLILISMATIGQYTGRIYQEAQNRPLYIVESLLEHKK